MEQTRRDFLTIGATTALAAMTSEVSAQETKVAAGAGVTVPADQRLRLVTYVAKAGGAPSVGVVTASGRIVDIGATAKSMVGLIEAGPEALAAVRKFAASAKDDGPLVSEVRLLAPIPEIRRNIYAVGWNYVAHFEEAKELRAPGVELPEHPVFFTKAVHSLNGPFDPIPYDPAVSVMIDWECELAVIIGKKGRNITEANALDHVFGYTVINDTTARDLQQKKHGGQWFKGKSLDGHGPMGAVDRASKRHRSCQRASVAAGEWGRQAGRYDQADVFQGAADYCRAVARADAGAGGYHRNRNAPGDWVCAQTAGVHEAGRCHGDRDCRDRDDTERDRDSVRGRAGDW